MPNFIKLLLENYHATVSRRLKTSTTTSLDTQAMVLCHQALMTAPAVASGQFNGRLLTAALLKAGIERLLTIELSRVNLRDPKKYSVLVQAIQVWKPAPLSGLAEKNCQKIRQALWTLLPDIRKKQQLQAECVQYKHYLKADIETQLRCDHPTLYAHYVGNQPLRGAPLPDFGKLPAVRTQPGGNMERFAADYSEGVPDGGQSLHIALQKYAAVDTMQQTLIKPQPVSAQLTQFRQALSAKRAILEQDRDSAAMKFVKGVATICSLGVAVLFGIWSVKGKTAAHHMQHTLETEPALPVLAAGRF